MDPNAFTPLWQHPLIIAFVASLGACAGSFLNVVIYRLPLNLSVNEPKRSFCFSCNQPIPWFRNLPIISWLILRGKCADCGARISPRYLFVELLTAVLFVSLWWHRAEQGWGVMLVLFVLLSLLIAATFIDFDHQIIPDGITWGGCAVGLILSALLPLADLLFPQAGLLRDAFLPEGFLPMHPWWKALGVSLLGAAAGYGLIWSVVELGKLAFGRQVHEFEQELPWKFHEPSQDAEPQLEVGEDVYLWSDLFGRATDQLIISTSGLAIDGQRKEAEEIRVFYNRVEYGETTTPIEEVKVLSGKTSKIVQPREAMGRGDIKFVAMIGAFLGWQSTLFALLGGAVLGTFGGLLQKFGGGERWGKPIPFGPYLALATLIFLFVGPEWIDWYLRQSKLR
ncbi:MAG: prepilin peptidase [Verrucomicrobiota bacterium]